VSKLGIRRRLLLVVVTTVAIALVAMIVGFNVLLGQSLSHNADSLVRARASAELGLLRQVDGRIVLGEAPEDAGPDTDVWIFSRGKALEAPRASPQVSAAARLLAGGPARAVDIHSADFRLYAEPVVVDGRRLGTIVAGVSLAPYEETRRTALLASLGLGVGVLLLVAIAARWLLASSLRPVARMTRQAAAWSEHDLDQRFALGEPGDELTELASTLDGLLDRLAASLRREQRFSAELSHELRTPLARMLAETELALRRERQPEEYRAALELVQRNAQQLSRTIDALMAAARHVAGTARGTADAYAVAAEAADACSTLAADRGLELDVVPPSRPLRIGVDHELAERILQPVVENACRYGRGHASISIERSPAGVVYAVVDDGPGVEAVERDLIFEPGERGWAGRMGGDGAGLGLALARRLARSASGDVEAETGDGGSFRVRLPAG
jgi:two-component system OmpR family sensor kinase